MGGGRAPGIHGRAGAAVSRMRGNAAGRGHTVIAVSSSLAALAALVLGPRRERLWGAMLAVQMAPGQTGGHRHVFAAGRCGVPKSWSVNVPSRGSAATRRA